MNLWLKKFHRFTGSLLLSHETKDENVISKFVNLFYLNKVCRGEFRALSNIYDGAFHKHSKRLKAGNYFRKKIVLRCLAQSWIRLWYVVPLNCIKFVSIGETNRLGIFYKCYHLILLSFSLSHRNSAVYCFIFGHL